MKIGILGGSFNPPHKMHKTIALELIEKNYVDNVIYVPTGNKYNKKDLIDAKHRLEMLEIMTQNNDNLLVSDYEVKNILTYTYQTLDYFKSIYPNDEIYFICGSDNLKEITTWKNYKYILENYKLLVIKRNEDDVFKIVNELESKNIVLANMPTSTISSTEIRKNLRVGITNDELDDKVLNYIIKKGIYI